MKKFLIAAVTASVIATPAVAAPYHVNRDKAEIIRVFNGDTQYRGQAYRNERLTKYERKQQRQYRKWAKGQRFDRRYVHNYRTINAPRQYGLYNAPRGYQWVQSDNDAVLIALASGLIGAVIGNAF